LGIHGVALLLKILIMNKIAIYGGGGFGREVKMLINQINNYQRKYEFIGYFDDVVPKGSIIERSDFLGGINELNSFSEKLLLVVSIADPKIKLKIIESINNSNISFPILIHPSCIIGDFNIRIGEGSIICASTIITVNVEIGNHVILNLACTVGHDTRIGSYSSFMPAVNISGEVLIGDQVYCGTGVKIINQVTIGEGTIVGAGALVHKDLPPHCTAVGFPAKPIKYHNE
jgi:sugar O-acyltransferase (sialic acid O-acetyltransferase NeuD family)